MLRDICLQFPQLKIMAMVANKRLPTVLTVSWRAGMVSSNYTHPQTQYLIKPIAYTLDQWKNVSKKRVLIWYEHWCIWSKSFHKTKIIKVLARQLDQESSKFCVLTSGWSTSWAYVGDTVVTTLENTIPPCTIQRYSNQRMAIERY